MLFIRLLRFMKGVVVFTLSGGFTERFLNLCMRAGIPVFDTVRRPDCIRASTTAHSYRAMRPIAKKTGVRMRLHSKSGLPFLLHRYRRRGGLLVGILLFAAFLGVMSQFLWSIEIEGNESIPQETIVEKLRECGVREGAYTRGIDTFEAERQMQLLLPDISWIAINLRASTASIEIRERSRPPELIDDNTPCNVVSARTGQIVEMEVYDGEPVLHVGDTVEEGQLVVNSFIGGIRNRSLGRLVHARAKIVVEFPQDVTIRVPLEEEIREPVGETSVKRSVNLFGVRIPLYFTLPDGTCNVYSQTTQPFVIGLKLPLTITRETYEPVRVHTVSFTEDQAREEALSRLLDYEQDFAQVGEIVSKMANGEFSGNEYVVWAQYILRQDAAREQVLHPEAETADETSSLP